MTYMKIQNAPINK